MEFGSNKELISTVCYSALYRVSGQREIRGLDLHSVDSMLFVSNVSCS